MDDYLYISEVFWTISTCTIASSSLQGWFVISGGGNTESQYFNISTNNNIFTLVKVDVPQW